MDEKENAVNDAEEKEEKEHNAEVRKATIDVAERTIKFYNTVVDDDEVKEKLNDHALNTINWLKGCVESYLTEVRDNNKEFTWRVADPMIFSMHTLITEPDFLPIFRSAIHQAVEYHQNNKSPLKELFEGILEGDHGLN